MARKQQRMSREFLKKCLKKKREKKKNKDEKGPPRQQRTIENTAIVDETKLQPDDQEHNLISQTFTSPPLPKILITSAERPSLKSHLFMKELGSCIPNSDIRLRKGAEVKKFLPFAARRGYTAVIIVNEDTKVPNGLLVVHLPEGPSLHFKVSSFRRGYDIRHHGRCTSHQPEVILNNFTTHLGHSVGQMLSGLFPRQPQFRGRQVVTFHNQRDYIFVRRHRYIFKNAKRVGMQELGPRFTLKLRSVQRGTFDSKYGEYIWIKEKEDKQSKRKFYL